MVGMAWGPKLFDDEDTIGSPLLSSKYIPSRLLMISVGLSCWGVSSDKSSVIAPFAFPTLHLPAFGGEEKIKVFWVENPVWDVVVVVFVMAIGAEGDPVVFIIKRRYIYHAEAKQVFEILDGVRY